MIPTYRRPDLLRRAVLQWIVQTKKPDVLCVHQNGSEESYEWAVHDLKHLINIQWVHTPKEMPQHFWYLIPLSVLLNHECDVFLWADHDDIYYTNHVETVLKCLDGYDITLSDTCGVLYVEDKNYKYQKPEKFSAHAPGGMSSSIAFTRKFAVGLQLDLLKDKEHYYSDNVLAFITMPRHQKNVTSNSTTVYVAHAGSHTSAHWVNQQPKQS